MLRTRVLTAAASATALAVIALGSPLATTADSSAPPSAPPSTTPAATAASTPEATIERFVSALANADVEGVLKAWAIDEAASGFDFTKRAEVARYFLPLTDLSPNTSPMYTEINRQIMRGYALNTVRMMTYSLLTDVPLEPNGIAKWDAAKAAEFAASADPARLRGLKMLDSKTVREPARYHERQVESTAKVFGAEDVTERVTLIELDGKTYAFGATLLRYRGEWKIFQGSSPLAAFNSMRGAVPMTRAQFDELTSLTSTTEVTPPTPATTG